MLLISDSVKEFWRYIRPFRHLSTSDILRHICHSSHVDVMLKCAGDIQNVDHQNMAREPSYITRRLISIVRSVVTMTHSCIVSEIERDLIEYLTLSRRNFTAVSGPQRVDYIRCSGNVPWKACDRQTAGHSTICAMYTRRAAKELKQTNL